MLHISESLSAIQGLDLAVQAVITDATALSDSATILTKCERTNLSSSDGVAWREGQKGP